MKHLGGIPELPTKAKIGVILIVVVFVGAIATFVITSALSRQITTASGEKIDFTKETADDRQQKAITTAAQALKNGDEQQAKNVYQQAIDAEPDATKKVRLAIDQSKILNISGKFDQALTVAKQAESYSSDKYLISDWLGRLYAIGKQYDNAIIYDTAAESLVSSKTNDGGYTKQYYIDRIAAMKSLSEKK